MFPFRGADFLKIDPQSSDQEKLVRRTGARSTVRREISNTFG